MKKTANIGADFTLIQTKDACEQVQRGGFQLEIISTSTVVENGKSVAKNKAVFQSAHTDEILNELTFIEVGTDDSDAITKKMKDEARKPICDSQIHVENELSRVLVFGKIV